MKITKFLLLFFIIPLFSSCQKKEEKQSEVPFDWKAANVYFLLTDRFNNGNKKNDINFGRVSKTGILRGFEGGDIQGVTQKIEEKYFDKLGINAIWLTPIVEQIHGYVDEGTGNTYGFHGYWAKDWTRLDPNFGTAEDLAKLVETAHKHGIRIILDAVINHTGPITDKDGSWGESWVRTEPTCTYKNFETTTACTLVENLPDIKTESTEEVQIPDFLAEKWKKEGRYEQEMQELDEFFKRTGYPKAPRFYIIKWLCDYILKYGIDGYRCDTVKHTGEDVWKDFAKECQYAFEMWKHNNPTKVLDKNDFYLVGEVYGYNANNGLLYDFGDKKIDYFANGFESLINFGFKYDSQKDYETLFAQYNTILHKKLNGNGTLNYLTSHDDGTPFDAKRRKSYESANKLLLSLGTAQIYYGDETARSLIIDDAVGDANLRSKMNWEDVKTEATQKILVHWQKLGQFRKNHPSIGAGMHKMISKNPYVFTRTYEKNGYIDHVWVGLNLPKGKKILPVPSIANGTKLQDAYSGETIKVKNETIELDTEFNLVLLEIIK